MNQERIIFRATFKAPSINAPYTETTSISFIPVCDNCNYVFDRVSGRIGVPYLEPFMCPKCNKIIDCARLPMLDKQGRLNYEED